MNKVSSFLLLLLIATASFAQNKSDFWDRVVFGGGLGAQFGDITLVQISPNVGYLLTDEWVLGVGTRYMYLNDNTYNYETSIYGGSLYSQYYFLDSYIAHAEVEELSLEAYDINFTDFKRRNVTSVLIGGGLKMAAGRNSFITLLGLWNINESRFSPYVNPIIRAGIIVGI